MTIQKFAIVYQEGRDLFADIPIISGKSAADALQHHVGDAGKVRRVPIDRCQFMLVKVKERMDGRGQWTQLSRHIGFQLQNDSNGLI